MPQPYQWVGRATRNGGYPSAALARFVAASARRIDAC